MPFPSATMNHEASPLLHDQPPGQVHVVPGQDAKAHVVKLGETCWCQPQVIGEGEGYATHIHHPVTPVVVGHALRLRKVLIGTKDGVDFEVEIPRGPQP